ncbi:DUF488 domain-containing protein [Devosia sp. PTR5]|uniref:DUF488 domain-containing protein n=1 Tax=Devosia oryzisoli TaxID=2774138 RepID=A0A927FRR4_9HYPH|nr:DUF488 domain-containing protein [Devosia oryzisoli]MBD8064811.1 DUF488 domain-containing protein [Devosia oryzisoli]
MNPFFTIGHSTRTIEEFAALLQQSEIRHLVDVRTVPRSRTNPQFNLDAMEGNLAPYQITYRHIAQLGGLRGRQKQVESSANALWRNQSFRNYADYAQTAKFRSGLDELIEVGETGRTAMMCAEAVWWRCHRRIIADNLLARGFEVFHIMGEGNVPPATLTPGAVCRDGGVLYPPVEA